MESKRWTVAALTASMALLAGCSVTASAKAGDATKASTGRATSPLDACAVVAEPVPGWPVATGSRSRLLVVLNAGADGADARLMRAGIAELGAVVETRTTTADEAAHRSRGGQAGILAGLDEDDPFTASITVDFPTETSSIKLLDDYYGWSGVLGVVSSDDDLGDLVYELLDPMAQARADVELDLPDQLREGADIGAHLDALRRQVEQQEGVVAAKIIDEEAGYQQYRNYMGELADDDLTPEDFPAHIEVETEGTAATLAIRRWGTGRGGVGYVYASFDVSQLLLRQAVSTPEGRQAWSAVADRLRRVEHHPQWAVAATRVIDQAVRTGEPPIRRTDDPEASMTERVLDRYGDLLSDCDEQD